VATTTDTAAEVTVTVNGDTFSYSLSWEEVASLFASGKLRKVGRTTRAASRPTTKRAAKRTTSLRRATKSTRKTAKASKRTPFGDVKAWAEQSEGKKALRAAGLDPARLQGIVAGNLANKYRDVYEQHI